MASRFLLEPPEPGQAISAQLVGLFILAFFGGQVLVSPLFFVEPQAVGFFLGVGFMALLFAFLIYRLRHTFGFNSIAIGFRSAALQWYIVAFLSAAPIGLATGSILLLLSPESGNGLQELAESQTPGDTSFHLFLTFCVLCIFTPFIEETLFRGALFTFVFERLGAFGALLITSLVFGLAHTTAVGAAVTGFDAILVLLSLSVVGLGAGILRWQSNSVFPAMLLHGAYNFMILNSQLATP